MAHDEAGSRPVQAVVPAAGEGTRMRPLTEDRPKGLVDVGDRPLLAHVFDALRPVASECVVVVGYRGDQIIDYFGQSYRNLDLTYVRQSERRGLADALLQAGPHIDGDMGTGIDAADAGSDISATGADGRNRQRITGIVEKPSDPPSRLVPRGCYALSPAIFDACRLVEPGPTGERELTDAIDLILGAGRRLETVPLTG